MILVSLSQWGAIHLISPINLLLDLLYTCMSFSYMETVIMTLYSWNKYDIVWHTFAYSVYYSGPNKPNFIGSPGAKYTRHSNDAHWSILMQKARMGINNLGISTMAYTSHRRCAISYMIYSTNPTCILQISVMTCEYQCTQPRFQ